MKKKGDGPNVLSMFIQATIDEHRNSLERNEALLEHSTRLIDYVQTYEFEAELQQQISTWTSSSTSSTTSGFFG